MIFCQSSDTRVKCQLFVMLDIITPVPHYCCHVSSYRNTLYGQEGVLRPSPPSTNTLHFRHQNVGLGKTPICESHPIHYWVERGGGVGQCWNVRLKLMLPRLAVSTHNVPFLSQINHYLAEKKVIKMILSILWLPSLNTLSSPHSSGILNSSLKFVFNWMLTLFCLPSPPSPIEWTPTYRNVSLKNTRISQSGLRLQWYRIIVKVAWEISEY